MVQTTLTGISGGLNRARLQKEKADEEKAAQRRLEEEKANMTEQKKQEKEAEEAARAATADEKREDEKGATNNETSIPTMEAADAVRKEVDKKKRAAERAREEEAAKVTPAKETDEASGIDRPDVNINEHLHEMNSGGGEGNKEDMEMEEEVNGDEEAGSPVKKKTRSSKNEKRKERKSKRKDKEAAEKLFQKKGKKRDKPSKDKGEDPIEETGGSSMRDGRFGGTSGKKATVATKPPHDHVHKREYVEGSVVLVQEGDRHTEFTMKLRGFLKEGQKVDEHLVIVPLKEGRTEPIINTPNEIPLNQTDLGTHVKVDPRATFEKRRPWGKDKANIDEEDWPDPEVWFSTVISCDLPPEEILDRARHEWKRNGGRNLRLLELKTHNPEGAVVLYHMYNQGSEESIIAEGINILTKARDAEAGDMRTEDFKWAGVEVPKFTLQLKVPNIPGQDTSKMSKMSWQMKNQRKAYHMVCDRSHTAQLQELMTIAKDRNLVKPVWGKQVKPSNAIAKGQGKRDKTPSWVIQNIKSFTKHHVNFHASMTAVGFEGIWDLDKEVAIYNVLHPSQIEGWMSLRVVMYSKLKLGDEHPLLAEIHQKHAMGDVEAVIPNVDEAEVMVAMINKNVVAYLSNYLVDVGLPKAFVTDLLQASCDPSLFHCVSQCKWDKKKRLLSTPEDEEKAKEEKMQKAAWYKDDFGAFMDSPKKKKGGGQNHVDPEHIYDLEGTHSVKSIRERPGKGKKYGGSPGAPAFQVGGEKTPVKASIAIDDSDEDEEANLSKLTREELIARLEKATISGKPKGSAPASETEKSHSNSEEEESSSEDSSDESGSNARSTSGSSAESNESKSGAVSG